MRQRWIRFTLVGMVFSLAGPQGSAHQLGIARVRLVETGKNRFLMAADLPPNSQFESSAPLLPASCSQDQAPVIERRQGTVRIEIGFACRAALGTRDVLHLPWPLQGAFVATKARDEFTRGRFFQATPEGIEIPLAPFGHSTSMDSRMAVAKRYLELGIEHILTGWDHLCFVLTLCLIASGMRLLKLVSAFTLGHSLTLALATVGVVHVPIPPTEACIALSIAFMARAAVRPDVVQHGAALVFSFGLLHGLGFATALTESGIDRSEFFLGLVTFNLGVEVGQLLFVAVVFVITLPGRRRSPVRRSQLATVIAYFLGIIGAFWTLQRTFVIADSADSVRSLAYNRSQVKKEFAGQVRFVGNRRILAVCHAKMFNGPTAPGAVSAHPN